MAGWAWLAFVAVLATQVAVSVHIESDPDSGVTVGDKGVVDLTDSNFDSLMGETGGTWFIKFFAPWCGHCKHLAPTWDDLHNQLPQDAGVTIGRVDATQQGGLAARFGIEAYPSLVLITEAGLASALAYEYEGGRSADQLVAFATGGFEGGKAKPVPGVAGPPPETAGSGGGGTVVDLTDNDFDGTLQAAGGKWFIKFFAPWCGHCKSLAPVWDDLPGFVGSDVTIARVDTTVQEALGTRFQIQGYPTLLLITDVNDKFPKVWKYSGPRSPDSLAAFTAGGYLSGESTLFPPPPPPPRPAGESDIIILTDENITTAVESDRAWLVLFYAPWCPHCQRLDPVWEELATKVNLDEDSPVRVGKLDAVAETVSGRRMGLEGYPTIYMFSKGLSYEYKEGRSVSELEKFMTAYAEGEEEGKAIPPVPGLKEEVIEVLNMLQADFMQLWNFKKMVLAIVFAAGIAVGAILVAILTPVPKPKKAGTPKAQGAPKAQVAQGSPKAQKKSQ